MNRYNIRIEQLKHSKFAMKTLREKNCMKNYQMVHKS